MDSLSVRRYEMLKRIKNFAEENPGTFPEGSYGKELIGRVNRVVSELENHGANQVSGKSAASASSATKATIREDLRESLLAINRTARVAAFESPNFEGKFRFPRNVGDQTLLTAARAFISDAEPLKEVFIRYELPANFLEKLAGLIEAFDQVMNEKTNAVGSHIIAKIEFDENLGLGLQTVRQLDVIIRNKFNNDPIILSAWARASHVASRTRSAGVEEPTTTDQ